MKDHRPSKDYATGVPIKPATIPLQTQESSYRMNNPKLPRHALALLSALALLTSSGRAQTVQQPAPSAPTPAKNIPVETAKEGDEETLLLSPFTVNATSDSDSYLVKETLAGARVRTDLRDIASSLTVVNSKFLRDTGAKNNQDLLVYMANTEVGGLYGNYGGVGGTFIDGANESANFAKPNSNTRVRGLDSADNTRDYFGTDIPWDSYNVDRVDLQRGPNSILFGFGSPAGIINNSVNAAGYKTQGKFENRIGSFGSVRDMLDFNYVIRPNELSVRVSLLDDETKYKQKPAFNHDKRIFAALRADPKLFASDSAHTTFRANFENGRVTANRPRILPPSDRITPWFDPNGMNKKTYDPYQAWQWGIVPYSSSTVHAGATKDYWIKQGMGINGVNTPMFVYDNPSASTQTQALLQQSSPNTNFGLNSSGQLDRGIDGFPYGSQIGIASYNEYAYDSWRADPTGPTRFPAADKGFYKTKSLTDPSIFDFYNKLIDGPNKKEWEKWNAANLSLSQTFFNNRLAFEAVYDYQSYGNGQERNLNNPYISVDINKDLMNYPWVYTAPIAAVVNPNAGRAYVGDSAKNGGNSSFDSVRKNYRFTGYGELRAADYFGKSALSDILGTHRLTALWARENYDTKNQNWVRYAAGSDWSDAIGNGPAGTNQGGLQNGDRVVDWIVYLSPNLASRSTATGLNLDRIQAVQSPHGQYTIGYYDSHPKDTFKNFGDPWYNPAREADTTQSENPANYKGWTSGSFSIYNADYGDRDRLLTEVSNVHKSTTSKGGVWQAYLWDDTLVGTIGYRRDKQDITSEASQYTNGLNGLGPYSAGYPASSTGNSTSWGLVLHTPKAIRKNLPWGTDVSLTYSRGKNTRVETRFGFSGQQLPNSTGQTDDYGIMVNTLNDRLQAKVTFYKTKVANANLSSVTTEVSTLGNNTYYLRNLEAWGTASALTDLAGRAGQAVGWEWYWNWALVDHGFDGAYNNYNTPLVLNDPSTLKETAAINSWLSQMMPQSWFDAYGFPVNVAKAKAGDFAGAIAGWTATSGVGGVQPAGGGRINGVWPTGTANNESKGVEIEVVGEPIKGWNINFNITKQTASQTSLGAELSSFIEASYKKYQSAAGDLRLWWGGDQTVRDYYTQNIWSAYQFQLKSSGRLVPEMSPWRYNLTTNYDFRSGPLKGANIGGGYRWEDKTIVGYALNKAKDNLDIDHPYWGSTRDYIDLWVGYQKNITAKINWRIQLNVRELGKKANLIPISVQPDGSPAQFRINEGQSWQLTNTFSF